MVPLILGVMASTGFLTLTALVYGLDALSHAGWAWPVFWGLIGMGALMSALGREARDV